MAAVAPLATATWRFVVTSTMAPGLPALRTTASADGARLISGGTIGVTSTSTATTSFVAPTITPGLPSATTTATPVMLTTAMASAGDYYVTALQYHKNANLLRSTLLH